MARRINGVLVNFLRTYTSRYSDFQGYWLFGFLVVDLVNELRIDLLAPSTDRHGPALDLASRLASEKFHDQVRKGGIAPDRIRGAWPTIRRSFALAEGTVNDSACLGYRVGFRIEVLMDGRRRYEQEVQLFVAPHNPELERRRSRGDRGANGQG